MAKRYRFRKVYILVEDGLVFDTVVTNVIFRDREYALERCMYEQRKAIDESKMQYMKGKPIPQHKVHGFYLVHESLFDEILKNFSKKWL